MTHGANNGIKLTWDYRQTRREDVEDIAFVQSLDD